MAKGNPLDPLGLFRGSDSSEDEIEKHGYKTIYADPPWNERGAGKIKRGAGRHYELMKTEEIVDMKDFVEGLMHPEGCHLYLWTTNNFLKDGLRVMEEWGFEYITTITWMKKGMGLGQYYRGLTEHCLFGATPERLPYRELPSGKRAQGKTGFIEEKGEHSEKPEQMRRWIEEVSHPPRIELFAREKYEEWDTWGKEAPNDGVQRRFDP